MFAGFNREVRNSLRLMGLRIRYAVAAVEIAAEQYGAVVASNIDLLLRPRGTGRLRVPGNNVTIGNDQTVNQVTYGDPELIVARASDRLLALRMDNNRALLINPVTSLSIVAAQGVYLSQSNTSVGAIDSVGIVTNGMTVGRNWTAFTWSFGALFTDRAPSPYTLTGAAAWASATTNITGANVSFIGGNGASGSAGAANGGHVYTLGGQGFGTGVRGYVYLGWDGTSAGHAVLGGLLATRTNAPTVASAGTIAPTAMISFVSGTTTISTITAPAPISSGGGQITLIPTGLWSTDTAGNIALATTAVVSKALILTYDTTTAKWYPSY